MGGTAPETLLALGKAQVDALFARYEHGPAMDDSEFLPLLEAVLTAFEAHGLSLSEADILWDHAYGIYDRLCKGAEPESTFEENRGLMRSYLLGKRKLGKRRYGV
jgi:hypothetical protein